MLEVEGWLRLVRRAVRQQEFVRAAADAFLPEPVRAPEPEAAIIARPPGITTACRAPPLFARPSPASTVRDAPHRASRVAMALQSRPPSLSAPRSD